MVSNRDINQKIINIIYNDIIKNKIVAESDVIIIGLSGGKDSMCLLDVMLTLSEIVGFKVYALHINHGIRGEEADRDLNFVLNYCEENRIECYYKKVDVIKYVEDSKLSLEEAARALRYNAYEQFREEILKKENNDRVFIMTAHHMTDQAETILHNVIRGAGIKGAIGMKKVNGFYIRPFLNIRKEDIDEYIKELDIEYVEDSTNSDLKYTRNFIRHEILNKLNSINEKSISHICEFSEIVKNVDAYFEKVVSLNIKDIIVEKSDSHIVVDSKKFNEYDYIIKYYMLHNIFDILKVKKKDITKIHINDIINISMGPNRKHLDLPHNLILNKEENKLNFKICETNYSMSRKIKK